VLQQVSKGLTGSKVHTDLEIECCKTLLKDLESKAHPNCTKTVASSQPNKLTLEVQTLQLAGQKTLLFFKPRLKTRLFLTKSSQMDDKTAMK
jgi:hypothetical protein